MALTDLAYDYGPDGQLTEIRDQLDPSKSKTISYDHLNRLVQVAEGVPVIDGGVPIPVEDYAYDEEGNRTTSHLSALYSSNDHNQLLEDDGFTYAYDDRGNRVSKTSKADGSVESYSYDSQNRLVGYASPTTTASYAYDALDRRIAKEVDGASEAFIYDGSSVLLDYADGAFNTRWQHGPSIDEPLAFERAGTEYALHSDHLGSPREVVEVATGTIAASYRYASFGARTQTGLLTQRYAFTGREEDLESGLIYYRARHYDPATGTFIQRDPIGFAGGDANLYAYVWNDHFNWSDPSGLHARAPKRMAGTATVAWLILAGRASVTIVGGLIDDVANACLNSPGCRGAAISGIKNGAEAVHEALGVKPLPGSGAGSGNSGSAAGLGGASIGLANGVGGKLAELAVKMEPDDVDGDGDAESGGGDGDTGGDQGGGDDDEWSQDDRFEWTDHAIEAMMDEDISELEVETVIDDPLVELPGSGENTIELVGDRVTVVVDETSRLIGRERIVTVYLTR
ncbi:RHS repeat domain-containing protein [Pelagimonas phthalicica]|uniref:RHS repeat domain-containing protein n=1 Tax=Pelagimonas phthalicica TaxID=1037362 RepID=UPI00159BC0B2|nr:RHS repeat-associated core domain-containing protein [Pelagimonas phthalicica]